jgi:hypothetical protein
MQCSLSFQINASFSKHAIVSIIPNMPTCYTKEFYFAMGTQSRNNFKPALEIIELITNCRPSWMLPNLLNSLAWHFWIAWRTFSSKAPHLKQQADLPIFLLKRLDAQGRMSHNALLRKSFILFGMSRLQTVRQNFFPSAAIELSPLPFSAFLLSRAALYPDLTEYLPLFSWNH